MKITKDKYYKTFDETISYIVYFRKDAIIPVNDKLTITFSSKTDNFTINFQGLTFSLWLDQILKHKLVVSSEHHLEVEPLKEWFGEPLFVENVQPGYLYKTIFQIMQKLLPENITLESISYE